LCSAAFSGCSHRCTVTEKVSVLLTSIDGKCKQFLVSRPFGSKTFDSYWSLEEIYEYMDELEAEFPDITEVEQMGRTEGGVEIRGLRVTSEEHLGQETLPIMFITAGASARDWIATMAAVNLMHELVEHYDDFQNIVDNVEWFIIPVANPDGYNFSRTEGVRLVEFSIFV
jgi:murein tripeptide amidase MpaA